MKKKNQVVPNNSFTEFLLYTTPNDKVKVEIFLHNENIWLTQDKIAMLFGVQRPAITKHLKNVFESGELDEKVVSSILEHTTEHGALEGKTQTQFVKFYNAEALALGEYEKYRAEQDKNYISDFDEVALRDLENAKAKRNLKKKK